MASTPATVVDQFRGILNDPRRNQGEFQLATGIKDNKLFCSSRYFQPPLLEGRGYEVHTSAAVMDFSKGGYSVESTMHSHPDNKNPESDPKHFSDFDITQAQTLQAKHPAITVRSYLLTPAPDNMLMVFIPKESKEHPNGETIGFFAKNGNFVITDHKFDGLLKGAKLTVP